MYRPRVESLVTGFHDYLEKVFKSRGKNRADKKEEIEERLKNVLENIFCENDRITDQQLKQIESNGEKMWKEHEKRWKVEKELKELKEKLENMKST